MENSPIRDQVGNNADDLATNATVTSASASASSALSAHTGATVGAHAASAIANTPAGGIEATTVQAAINELDGNKQTKDATLTAISGLDASAGLVYQSGEDTFVKKAIGTTAGTVAAGDDSRIIAGGTALQVVTTDSTLTGSGTVASPLGVNVQSDDVIVDVTDEDSLIAAIDEASKYSMANGKYVKIQLPAGNITLTETLLIDTAAKISIAGQPMTSTTLTSKVSNSGSTGSYSVVLGVADESIFDVDSYCYISSNITGTGNYSYFRGCYKVTNVDAVNHRITIEYPYLGTFPTATITGGTIERYTSTVTVSGGIVGFFIRCPSVRMGNFVIVGGFQALNFSFISGFYGSKISMYKQTGRCVSMYDSASVRFDNSNFIGCSDSAVETINSSLLAILNGVVVGSVYGLFSNYGSNISAASNIVVGNTNTAIAQNNSGINLNSATYTGALSPNGNAVGNNGSIITV